MIIRPFNPDDWDAVQSIHDLCKPDEMRGSVALSAIVPLSQDPPMLDLFARSSVFVMEEDGNVIGFAAHIGAYISWLCVHPARRRRGVASALLRHLLGRIDRPASLNVGKRNAPARQLYDAFGFQIAEDFIGKFNGHDVEVLKLQLPIGARADDRSHWSSRRGPSVTCRRTRSSRSRSRSAPDSRSRPMAVVDGSSKKCPCRRLT